MSNQKISNESQHLLEIATEAYYENDLETAHKVLSFSLSIQPENINTIFWFCFTCIITKKYEQFKKFFPEIFKFKNFSAEQHEKFVKVILSANPPVVEKMLLELRDDNKIKVNLPFNSTKSEVDEIESQKVSLSALLRRAKKYEKDGAIDNAASVYNEIIESYPGNKTARKELRRLLSLNKQTSDREPPAQTLKELYQLCNGDNFIKSKKILEQLSENYKFSMHLNTLNGIYFARTLDFVSAQKYFEKAVELNPKSADCHNNLGKLKLDNHQYKDAERHFLEALEIDCKHTTALSNLGSCLRSLGKLNQAKDRYHEVLKYDKFDIATLNNLANLLLEEMNMQEALPYFALIVSIVFRKQEVSLVSDNFITLADKQEIQGLTTSSAIHQQNHAVFLSNFSNVLFQLGHIASAYKIVIASLNCDPEYRKAWENLRVILCSDQDLKCKFTMSSERLAGFSKTAHYEVSLTKLICSIQPDDAKRLFEDCQRSSHHIYDNTNKKLPLNKIVTLTHYGRSGTGLLHSLFDNHPQVSTLPSVIFANFFDPFYVKLLHSTEIENVPNLLRKYFPLLFDGSADNFLEINGKKSSLSGLSEGLQNLGSNRDQLYKLDFEAFHQLFCKRARVYQTRNIYDIFILIHAVYDELIYGRDLQSVIFYHIHNPTVGARISFRNLVPDSLNILLVRDPIQALESWIRTDFNDGKIFEVVVKIVDFLKSANDPFLNPANSFALKLEDIKLNSVATLETLCTTMGIDYSDSLLKMTVAGRRWWGDPSSPNYHEEGMNPFGTSAINRSKGVVFSSSDLTTLNYILRPVFNSWNYSEEFSDSEIYTMSFDPEKNWDFTETLAKNAGMTIDSYKFLGPHKLFQNFINHSVRNNICKNPIKILQPDQDN